MPIDPISWAIIIGSFVAGYAVGYFWDEIKVWATRILGYIIDGLNRAIEVASNATVFLVKKGTRVYKKIEVIVRNFATGKYFKRYQDEEISPYDVPENAMSELSANPNVPVYQYTHN
ncbi:MAG: hypothetical protein HWQ35_24480 [Nostoc sp. NMS1]|uniref:hypothetical protein n=1 Tax=unclassified Nostoc TaxID=2593658 RepID=UPI0025DD3472|nr:MULTISPECIES: hypothetical protein [unclassified Nostoc]MBN3909577.1 hypothetical protein [Nostoc sp. NMS1]MBN3993760.1 hypothetical protein [Nostoc sp. NMS2]